MFAQVFVGFEYECPRGHRFMMQTPDKMLKHNAAGGPKVSLENNLELY
jgi:protein SMG8